MRTNLAQKEENRRQLMVKVIKAQEEERRRVARELHDNLGQCLSSLGFGLQSAALALDADPAKVRPLLRNLYEENLRSQNALRATIYAMRPSVLDDLGLIPALRSYAERRFAAQGIAVELTAQGEDKRLPSEIETAVFRITQEALNNIFRHADAKHVTVDAVLKHDGVDIEVTDDGSGFDAEKTVSSTDGNSIGILGMHERAELLDGWVKISSQPGRGCRVSVHIPVATNIYSNSVRG
jgi:signal transduction histidine kinase